MEESWGYSGDRKRGLRNLPKIWLIMKKTFFLISFRNKLIIEAFNIPTIEKGLDTYNYLF